ncbi:MAG TPA: hypothetical protein VF690_01595 [Hymenobacter sp.]
MQRQSLVNASSSRARSNAVGSGVCSTGGSASSTTAHGVGCAAAVTRTVRSNAVRRTARPDRSSQYERAR